MIKQYIRFSMDIISFYAPCVALQHEQLPLNGNLTDLRLGKLSSLKNRFSGLCRSITAILSGLVMFMGGTTQFTEAEIRQIPIQRQLFVL